MITRENLNDLTIFKTFKSSHLGYFSPLTPTVSLIPFLCKGSKYPKCFVAIVIEKQKVVDLAMAKPPLMFLLHKLAASYSIGDQFGKA